MYKLTLVVFVSALALILVLPAAAQERTVADIVVSDSRFDTLQSLVVTAGLEDTLAGPGPFTMFAPTDRAFAAIEDATLEDLLGDPGGRLTEILLYHVVPGEVTAEEMVGWQSMATVHGTPIKIDVEDGSIVLDRSTNVATTSIRAANGII